MYCRLTALLVVPRTLGTLVSYSFRERPIYGPHLEPHINKEAPRQLRVSQGQLS
jgi:hypothetical protein